MFLCPFHLTINKDPKSFFIKICYDYFKNDWCSIDGYSCDDDRFNYLKSYLDQSEYFKLERLHLIPDLAMIKLESFIKKNFIMSRIEDNGYAYFYHAWILNAKTKIRKLSLLF